MEKPSQPTENGQAEGQTEQNVETPAETETKPETPQGWIYFQDNLILLYVKSFLYNLPSIAIIYFKGI